MNVLYCCFAFAAILQQLSSSSSLCLAQAVAASDDLPFVAITNHSRNLDTHGGHKVSDDKALDAAMERDINTLEKTPQEVKALLQQLDQVDYSQVPVLKTLAEIFKTKVEEAINDHLPHLIDMVKDIAAEDRREREMKNVASTGVTDTKVTRILTAAAQKPEAEVIGTSKDNVDSQSSSSEDHDDDSAYMEEPNASEDDDEEDAYMEEPIVYEDHDEDDVDINEIAGKDYFKSKSKKNGGKGDFKRFKSKSKWSAGPRDHHFHDLFGSHTSPQSQRFQSYQKIHQGIYDGNHQHLMGIARGAHAHATRAHRELMMDGTLTGNRRLKRTKEERKEAKAAKKEAKEQKKKTRKQAKQENWQIKKGGPDYSKEKQCHLLAKCVEDMTLYEFMVFFYSDDLNKGTGELDDNIIHFDEESTLEDRRSNAISLARNLANLSYVDGHMNDQQSADCDDLLKFFHRNIEHDGVPHWEGGTVSQVCLAQGTQVYVKLDEIATKIGMDVADKVTEEMHTCSLSLYNKVIAEDKDKNPRESFVFSEVTSYVRPILINSITSTSNSNKAKNLLVVGGDARERCPWRKKGLLKRRGHKQDCSKMKPPLTNEREVHPLLFSRSYTSQITSAVRFTIQAKELFILHEIDFYWKARPEAIKVYFGNDKEIKKENMVYDDSNGAQSGGVYKLKKNPENVVSDSIELWRLKLDPSVVRGLVNQGSYVHVVCYTQKSNKNRVSGHAIVVKGTTGILRLSGKPGTSVLGLTESLPYEDFIVPNGLDFAKPPRDEYGHADSVGLPLYTYDGVPVSKKLTTMRKIGIQLYKHFQKHLNESETVTSSQKTKYADLLPHNETSDALDFDNSTGYEALEAYLDVLKLAEDDKSLKKIFEDLAEEEEDKDDKDRVANSIIWLVKDAKIFSETYRTRQWKYYINEDGDPTITYRGLDYVSLREDIFDYEKLHGLIADVYKEIQTGFAMVFGEKTSVGFVCGIAAAVKKKGKEKFPGKCCLDPPYKGGGDNWGRKHSCSAPCYSPGPFFGGLDEHACDAQGGTWCPSPADCSVLKNCVENEIKRAKINRLEAYEAYLEPAIIEDPNDFDQCGHSRQYFGYDELYTNDEDICDNFQQLHNTKDFGFLDEFFGPAAGGTPGGGAAELIAPDHSGSDSLDVREKKYNRWVFALQTRVEFIVGLFENTGFIECPADCTGAVQTGCALAKNIFMVVMSAIKGLITAALSITQFACDMNIGTSDANLKRSFEQNDVIFKNMEVMYERQLSSEKLIMKEMQEIKNQLGDTSTGRNRNLGAIGGGLRTVGAMEA